MKHLGIIAAFLGWAGVVRADAAPESVVKAAVEKGLKRIESGVINYPKHRQCFSCHHQAMAVLSMTAARERGFTVDADLYKKQIDFSLRSFRHKSIIAKGQAVGGDSTSVVYALQTFAAADRPYDDTMAALVDYLLVRQRKDGSWPVPAQRPPTMGSLFTNTGLALFALKKYSPPKELPGSEEKHKRIDAAFEKGRDWLLASKPISNEDKVFHLRGLVYAQVAANKIEEARDALLQDQRPDGSWAQLGLMAGDAYATATALAALHHAGLKKGNEGYRKGIQYLLDTQKESGSWIVQTRSKPLQIFFDNGDPGGKSQFISFAATNWSVLALLDTISPVSNSAGLKENTCSGK